jgi:hypothetical protein
MLSDGSLFFRDAAGMYSIIQKKWSGAGTPAPLFSQISDKSFKITKGMSMRDKVPQKPI